MTRESGNAALEVPPVSPDRDAYVADIAGLTEQFSDFVEDLFQRGKAEDVGELGQTLALREIRVELSSFFRLPWIRESGYRICCRRSKFKA